MRFSLWCTPSPPTKTLSGPNGPKTRLTNAAVECPSPLAKMKTKKYPTSVPIKGLNQSTEYAVGNFVTLRRTVAQAAQDLLHQERLYQQQQQQQQQNVAFRASLKRPTTSDGHKIKVLDEEADVRKEFTYEYVLTTGQQQTDPTSTAESSPSATPSGLLPKVCWPASSLMREKSSAIADLRARSESPSANRMLFLNNKDAVSALPAQLALAKSARPKPPPKPSLQDLEQAFQLKYRSNGIPLMMMMLEEEHNQQHPAGSNSNSGSNNNPSLSGSEAGQSRLSYAESLPESLAGFAASIVSEEGGSGAGVEGTISPPFEATVSPLTSECDWHHSHSAAGMNGNNGGCSSSPAPLPDLMSLSSTSAATVQCASRAQYENLYVNAVTEDGHEYSDMSVTQEDHYLPMTSAKMASRPPPPLPAANRSHFEENAYVEMTDNGKLRSGMTNGRGAPSSVFAGVFDPSYRPAPESPRYSEISDCPAPSSNRNGQEEDQPHYEFIYKASSHAPEPVYMEVPQGEEDSAGQNGHQQDDLETSRCPPDVPPSVSHSRQNSVSLDISATLGQAPSIHAMDGRTEDQLTSTANGEELLDLMVAPPRHPRFSISDTFRPASYFLQKLETIPSEDAMLDETTGSLHDGDESLTDSDELASPPPFPPASSASSSTVHHSRSQSLDYSATTSQGGRSSVDSNHHHHYNSQTIQQHPPASTELSRRRPLTVVRSLEDLLVDSNDDQLAAMSQQSVQPPVNPSATPTSAAFRGSTQSLASSVRSAGGTSTTWHQPLYENVSGAAHVRQASRHVRQASITSNHSTSRRPSTSPDRQTPIQGHRQRLGSAVSLSSTMSNSSVTRSEQSISSGAPYYYSDLLGARAGGTPLSNGGARPPSRDETIVVLDDGSSSHNGSLRSSSSRSAQAQAAKMAYQHSMDRLRAVRRASSSDQQMDGHQQTPTSSRQWAAGSNGQQNQQQLYGKRCQTPDLLAHNPEQQMNGSVSTTSLNRNGGGPGDVMRRVRSLEGLLDDDQEMSGQQSNGYSATEQKATTPTAVATPEVRYARNPTRQGPASSSTVHQQSPLETTSYATGDFSPWDEDQLWRDKLRRASIRHTRSMDMLDEISNSGSNGHRGDSPKKKKAPPTTLSPPPASPPPRPPDENGEVEDCYERLVQYSATLERTKRGQTYLDGYTWDEMEQRFRKPGRTKSDAPPPAPGSSTAATAASSSSAASTLSTPAHHFLEDGLPPPAFEIDREKLRQWDLMSTAAPIPEGGRQHRPAAAVQPTPPPPPPPPPPVASTTSGNNNNALASPRKVQIPPPPKPGPPPPPASPPVVAQHACLTPSPPQHQQRLEHQHHHHSYPIQPDLTSSINVCRTTGKRSARLSSFFSTSAGRNLFARRCLRSLRFQPPPPPSSSTCLSL